MSLRPLGDRVVVQPAKQDDRTTSGLFVPETAKERPQQGKVIAVGPGRRQENGERIALDVKLEDTVLYTKYAGTTIQLNGKEHLILKESDVLAIVKNDKNSARSRHLRS